MKKRIVISDEAYQAVKKNFSSLPWRDLNNVQLPDGRWDVEFEESTVASLDELRTDGETYSDTIIRMMREVHRPATDGTHRTR